MPERERVAGVEPAVGELVRAREGEVVEREELLDAREVEEAVPADLAGDVPQREAEDRPRGEHRPAPGHPHVRRVPADREGKRGEARREQEDERQGQRRGDEERHRERAEDDCQAPGDRRRDATQPRARARSQHPAPARPRTRRRAGAGAGGRASGGRYSRRQVRRTGWRRAPTRAPHRIDASDRRAVRRSGVGVDGVPAGERGCVYTVLLGRYERLTEQPIAAESGLEFVCFTDDPSLESETWSIRLVRPLLAHDAPRSQRALKIRAHAAVPEYDVSVYIDNSVLLKVPPERLLAELLPPDAGFAAMAHSFRDSIAAEFDAVVAQKLDLPGRCAEQREHYRLEDPASLELRPLKGALLLRRHHQPDVTAAMDFWFQHVLRYSRRDQLSLHATACGGSGSSRSSSNSTTTSRRTTSGPSEPGAGSSGSRGPTARSSSPTPGRPSRGPTAPSRCYAPRSARCASRARGAGRAGCARARGSPSTLSGPPSNASTSPEPSQDATSR